MPQGPPPPPWGPQVQPANYVFPGVSVPSALLYRLRGMISGHQYAPLCMSDSPNTNTKDKVEKPASMSQKATSPKRRKCLGMNDESHMKDMPHLPFAKSCTPTTLTLSVKQHA